MNTYSHRAMSYYLTNIYSRCQKVYQNCAYCNTEIALGKSGPKYQLLQTADDCLLLLVINT